MKRRTINDIAERAGVSKSAVSFALNGKPGVSPATRERILATAEALGWRPSSAARALSGARANVVGLVLARNPSLLAAEPYFVRLIAGMETELRTEQTGLLLKMVGEEPQRELEIYRRWWSQRQVDGVVLLDLRVNDHRADLVAELGLPAVLLGRLRGSNLPSVWVDTRPAMDAAVGHLADLGHRRVARVRGMRAFIHTRERDTAYRAAARTFGMESAVIVDADYTGEQGAKATRALLDSPDAPSAIIFDNDVMAVSAIGAAHDLGIRIPDELSIIAWDDSPLCELPRPALTAMRMDIDGLGAAAVRILREAIDGGPTTSIRFGTWELVERASTGRPDESRRRRS
ncbi:LacI family transcriptional regulator [Jiangella aurantiaca]|uniref:LacI family transcriptional regulator n=1 Tax=Jiangella aurantiaca TaxID=2530373 RepID=A0A4R5ALB4_9ACTN|nr:LacI family DNA-binding transcriptional regulator [Jiangella aurantiaca]TDD72675.1 LacI family transcriptional regulator [Jiangella aurantiaca]